jgi:hypothetical protein
VVTGVWRTRCPTAPLWYVAQPPRLQARVALDPGQQGRRPPPTLRVAVGPHVPAKVRAWYGYRSQRASLREGLPAVLPAWLALSMLPFEHFSEAPRA